MKLSSFRIRGFSFYFFFNFMFKGYNCASSCQFIDVHPGCFCRIRLHWNPFCRNQNGHGRRYCGGTKSHLHCISICCDKAAGASILGLLVFYHDVVPGTGNHGNLTKLTPCKKAFRTIFS